MIVTLDKLFVMARFHAWINDHINTTSICKMSSIEKKTLL